MLRNSSDFFFLYLILTAIESVPVLSLKISYYLAFPGFLGHSNLNIISN